ncbi:glycosyltransferase family 52 [Fusobacterium sp.]|uniref:glycosyltransferase family 52 n=1 Tax=Fusobacterium sp. TaxID=68766 RepID=UPI002615F835|nr:glycosyltransferase family 52 [Fusobacterium sp.]
MMKIIYVGGMRALIIYLLLNIKDLEKSIFFLENNYNINLKKYLLSEKGNKYVSRYKNYRLLKKITFNNEKKEFWIQDHLKYSPFFLGNFNNMILLEDGIENYTDFYKKTSTRIKYSIKNKILGGTFRIEKYKYGHSQKINKIYLTGLDQTPKEIEKKVELIKLKELWYNLTEEEKNKLLNIFFIKKEDINVIKSKKVILITQPISEDSNILEDEKIEIYKSVISKYKEKDILIKPHPREKTDYKKYFREAEILDKNIPMEMISFLIENLEEVITLFSTAIFEFKFITKVKFLGTNFDKRLVENFGKIDKI